MCNLFYNVGGNIVSKFYLCLLHTKSTVKFCHRFYHFNVTICMPYILINATNHQSQINCKVCSCTVITNKTGNLFHQFCPKGLTILNKKAGLTSSVVRGGPGIGVFQTLSFIFPAPSLLKYSLLFPFDLLDSITTYGSFGGHNAIT